MTAAAIARLWLLCRSPSSHHWPLGRSPSSYHRPRPDHFPKEVRTITGGGTHTLSPITISTSRSENSFTYPEASNPRNHGAPRLESFM
ncbi:hypothetical protein AVEN_72007-1 [Araneus ventricosus]|uniref:Uncharacterized protein n=1 Tax=Araneus ventricosus TaxID=182803 RepID=A0A4Y2DGP2_ARAVE|nr:hypothetical protein AVEN_72007-1 [Araneus ventricosus]